jgi:hypothetical protein
MLSLKIPFHWNQIWHRGHIPPGFSTNKTETPATRLLDSTRFNRMIILKIKQCGNMKTFYGPTTPTFCRQGNQCQTSPPLPLLQSRNEISFRGVVTPCVMNSLIMVISVLILHQIPWLIHFQAKPKELQMDFNLKSLWESQEIPNFGILNSCSWVYLSSKFNQDLLVQIAPILEVSIKFHSNSNT